MMKTMPKILAESHYIPILITYSSRSSSSNDLLFGLIGTKNIVLWPIIPSSLLVYRIKAGEFFLHFWIQNGMITHNKSKLICLIELTTIYLLIIFIEKSEKVGNIIKIRFFQCPTFQGLTFLICFLSFFD